MLIAYAFLALFCFVAAMVAMIAYFCYQGGKGILANRLDAYPKAVTTWENSKGEGKIVSDARYDAYVPDDMYQDKVNNVRIATVGLVFFPGALVDHRAYARVASRLAGQGILTVVVSLEPYRMASTGLETTSLKLVREIQNNLEATHRLKALEWALGGHSMGVGPAQEIAMQSDDIRKVVGWGKYHEYPRSNSLKSELQLLFVGATEDGFYFKSEEERKEFFASVPPKATGTGQPCTTTYFEIKGGNHSGFADYGPQNFPKKDGKRLMTIEQQHELAVGATSDFLLDALTYSAS